ncbi:hypothetical protein [Stenomitos frigidus]|nr:hypothetical protein [Stenomitos frigidus]
MTIKSSPLHHPVAISIHGRVLIGYTIKGEPDTVLLDPVRQAQVEIIEPPESFKRKLDLKSLSHGQNWESLSPRPDRTHTAVDGSFYFIDLPPDNYTLKASLPQKLTRLQVAKEVVTVVKTDAKLNPLPRDLVLLTTGIVGQVISPPEQGTKPVAYAQVKLKGGNEQTRCDRDGKFQLLNLEAPESPSTRSVQFEISASGYDLYTTDPTAISRGTVHRIQNIQLSKKSSTKANGTRP